MTVLSDASLRALVGDDAAVGPSSVDLHLGPKLLRLGYGVTIDPEQDQSALWTDVPLHHDGRFHLGRNELYLGVTAEEITVPGDMVAFLHGISSLGRLGLLVHCTAGLADSGYSGRLTLELVSLGGTLILRPGMRVAQITYHMLSAPCVQGYQGKYQNDVDPVPSRMFMESRP